MHPLGLKTAGSPQRIRVAFRIWNLFPPSSPPPTSSSTLPQTLQGSIDNTIPVCLIAFLRVFNL